jgi:hypothetical protein
MYKHHATSVPPVYVHRFLHPSPTYAPTSFPPSSSYIYTTTSFPPVNIHLLRTSFLIFFLWVMLTSEAALNHANGLMLIQDNETFAKIVYICFSNFLYFIYLKYLFLQLRQFVL